MPFGAECDMYSIMGEILEYLKEPGDVLPWDKKEAEKPRKVTSTKFGKKEMTEK